MLERFRVCGAQILQPNADGLEILQDVLAVVEESDELIVVVALPQEPAGLGAVGDGLDLLAGFILDCGC